MGFEASPAGRSGFPANPVQNWSGFSDEQLIETYRARTSAQADDALSELFRRYQAHIARWCVRFTQDRESALDLAQDILFRAYRSLHTFRGDARFSTWLYVIARNQCSSALQRRTSQPAYVDPSVAESLPDTSMADIHEVVESGQLTDRNWQMVRSALSQMEANVMMLHYGEEVPLSDITRTLGLTNKSGAKAYIVSARRKLTSLVRQSHSSGTGALA